MPWPELTCHACATPLVLLRTGAPHYRWQCPKHCLPEIDTEMPATEQLDALQPEASGAVEFNASHFFPPMTKSRIATTKVFMAQILYQRDPFMSCLASPNMLGLAIRAATVI